VASFVRGLDLSGSLQGAGGVGGVLAVTFGPSTNSYQLSTHFCAFDGNGNVSALVSTTNGAVTANYEYSPFGETLRANGVVAKANPIRFSTQLADDVTGDNKWKYREARPALGQWLNRDPIEELGHQNSSGNDRRRVRDKDENLYCFVGNNPITKFDLLGLIDQDVTAILNQFKKTMKELCNKKNRCDCPAEPLKDIHASVSSVWGCGAQADNMEGDIISILSKLDGKWSTDHRKYLIFPPIFYHQDVKITPLDAKGIDIDNIVLDTFKGCYFITRRTLVPWGGPNQRYYWLYSYESKCFTCDDFKK